MEKIEFVHDFLDLYLGVSQGCATQIVNSVAKILSSQHSRFIKMPDKAESLHIAEEMFQKYGIHGTIGAIDGTHLHISKPSQNGPVLPERFFNRKG